MSDQFVEHSFRQHYGALVNMLARRVGMRHLDVIEDAIQFAMMQALLTWVGKPEPDKPVAWLYCVAYRHVVSALRATKRRNNLHDVMVDNQSVQQDAQTTPDITSEDAVLNLLFVACNENVPQESQLVFTLKCLCGFTTPEVAQRLFTSQANIHKRFARAKAALQDVTLDFDQLELAEIVQRMPAVMRVIYLLFTEGYLSSHSEHAIRLDLCIEAQRLGLLLNASSFSGKHADFDAQLSALLALIHFNLARISSRANDIELILLEQQDRSLWDKGLIAQALVFLDRSTQSSKLTRYHLEASIAAEHCLANSYAETRWDRIVQSYEMLEKITQSPMHMLNRAIALAEWKSPHAALKMLQDKPPPAWLARSYHWYAVIADLSYRTGNNEDAISLAKQAVNLAPNSGIQSLLMKRFYWA